MSARGRAGCARPRTPPRHQPCAGQPRRAMPLMAPSCPPRRCHLESATCRAPDFRLARKDTRPSSQGTRHRHEMCSAPPSTPSPRASAVTPTVTLPLSTTCGSNIGHCTAIQSVRGIPRTPVHRLLCREDTRIIAITIIVVTSLLPLHPLQNATQRSLKSVRRTLASSSARR